MNKEDAHLMLVGIVLEFAQFSVVRGVCYFIFLRRTAYLLQGVDNNQLYVRVFFQLFVKLLNKFAV